MLWPQFVDRFEETDLLKVPSIYKAYDSGLCQGIYQQNMAVHSTDVQYLHFRILEFPLMKQAIMS